MIASVLLILGKISLSVVGILLDPGNPGIESVGSGSPSSSGVKGDESLGQEVILNEFRLAVADAIERDYERTDQFLHRWLLGNEMDVDSANQTFRKAQNWRRENDIDNILNETQHFSVKDICYLDGVSTEGGPVLVFRMSETDFRKAILAGYTKSVNRAVTRCFEDAQQEALKTGRELNRGIIPGAIVIANLHGFNMKQHFCMTCPVIYREFAEMEKYYYPRVFTHIIFVNAPAIFKPLLELLRPLFSSSIKETLLVFGNNKTEWFSYLSKIIPVHQLPQEFGGTKVRGVP